MDTSRLTPLSRFVYAYAGSAAVVNGMRFVETIFQHSYRGWRTDEQLAELVTEEIDIAVCHPHRQHFVYSDPFGRRVGTSQPAFPLAWAHTTLGFSLSGHLFLICSRDCVYVHSNMLVLGFWGHQFPN